MNRYGQDLLSYMGLRRVTKDWLPRTLVGFGAGMLVGAAAALILAPKPGAELRTDIADTANRIYQKGRSQVQKGIERAETKFNDKFNDVGGA